MKDNAEQAKSRKSKTLVKETEARHSSRPPKLGRPSKHDLLKRRDLQMSSIEADLGTN